MIRGDEDDRGSQGEKDGELEARAAAILLVAGMTFGVAGLIQYSPVSATKNSATRQFSESWVLPGGELTVTITATGYGGLGPSGGDAVRGFYHVGSTALDKIKNLRLRVPPGTPVVSQTAPQYVVRSCFPPCLFCFLKKGGHLVLVSRSERQRSCRYLGGTFCAAKLDSATSLAACRSLSLTCRTGIAAD